MSEWLGTGLQNRLHQFESGWNLLKSDGFSRLTFSFTVHPQLCHEIQAV